MLLGEFVSLAETKYRVSIKSFPDYKHLLQENYVEYKHIFFQNVTQLKKFLFTTNLSNGKKNMMFF
jgi:hypothetical protein